MAIERAEEPVLPPSAAAVRLAEIYDEYLETGEVVKELHSAFRSLMLLARRAGVVPTITLRAKQPLAMGNYEAVLELREHMAFVRDREEEVAELRAQIEREQQEQS